MGEMTREVPSPARYPAHLSQQTRTTTEARRHGEKGIRLRNISRISFNTLHELTIRPRGQSRLSDVVRETSGEIDPKCGPEAMSLHQRTRPLIDPQKSPGRSRGAYPPHRWCRTREQDKWKDLLAILSTQPSGQRDQPNSPNPKMAGWVLREALIGLQSA
jgi:hypothetical protein